MTEKIVTNSKTGGKKAAKPEAYSMLPWPQLREVARVYSMGAEKYEPYNWCKGYDWSLSFSSLIRHAEAFWSGENTDPESGLSHMAHAVFHCLTLIYFLEHHPELDDRHIPNKPTEGLEKEIVNFKYKVGDKVTAPDPMESTKEYKIDMETTFCGKPAYYVAKKSAIVLESEITHVNGVEV